MLKIQIIRTVIEDSNGKSGVGYYADYLESELIKSGHDVDTVVLNPDFKYGFRNIIDLIKSAARVIRGRKEFDIVHASAEHCALLFPLTKAKRVVTFHHVMRSGEADTRLWYLFWKLSFFVSKKYTDEYIAVSLQTKDNMIEALKIPENKITVAMHPPKFEMYKELILKENLILFVGMLMDRKNPEDSIHVFKKLLDTPGLQDYRFVMCGNGPKKDNLLRLISEMNLNDYVKITDSISVEELRIYYNKAKLLLNTSNYEGLGITTLESQLCWHPRSVFQKCRNTARSDDNCNTLQ